MNRTDENSNSYETTQLATEIKRDVAHPSECEQHLGLLAVSR